MAQLFKSKQRHKESKKTLHLIQDKNAAAPGHKAYYGTHEISQGPSE